MSLTTAQLKKLPERFALLYLKACEVSPERPVLVEARELMSFIETYHEHIAQSALDYRPLAAVSYDQLSDAELRAIVAKLPKTADGVPIVPGMKLYPLYPLPPESIDGEDDFAVVEMRATDPWGGDDIESDQLNFNYSSKEAAEAERNSRAAAFGPTTNAVPAPEQAKGNK